MNYAFIPHQNINNSATRQSKKQGSTKPELEKQNEQCKRTLNLKPRGGQGGKSQQEVAAAASVDSEDRSQMFCNAIVGSPEQKRLQFESVGWVRGWVRLREPRDPSVPRLCHNSTPPPPPPSPLLKPSIHPAAQIASSLGRLSLH